jgi:hypothetical protein
MQNTLTGASAKNHAQLVFALAGRVRDHRDADGEVFEIDYNRPVRDIISTKRVATEKEGRQDDCA